MFFINIVLFQNEKCKSGNFSFPLISGICRFWIYFMHAYVHYLYTHYIGTKIWRKKCWKSSYDNLVLRQPKIKRCQSLHYNQIGIMYITMKSNSDIPKNLKNENEKLSKSQNCKCMISLYAVTVFFLSILTAGHVHVDLALGSRFCS